MSCSLELVSKPHAYAGNATEKCGPASRIFDWNDAQAPTSAFAGVVACTTRPRARASITPTARSANNVTV